MKIYSTDGTIHIDNKEDTSFGWYLNDIPNRFKEEQEKINIHEAATEMDFELSHRVTDKVENIDEKVPSKNQILALINPCTVESKILLSVVHYTLYKNFNVDFIKWEHFKSAVRLNHCKNFDNAILEEIRKYPNLSLMMDLILSETGCDIDEVFGDASSKNDDSIDGEPILERSHLKLTPRSGDDSIEAIFNFLEELRKETKNIHREISQLKKFFRDELIRVNNLIKDGQTLEKNLREVTFLENLVHLFNGNLEKIVLKESPFRIFLPSGDHECSLIV